MGDPRVYQIGVLAPCSSTAWRGSTSRSRRPAPRCCSGRCSSPRPCAIGSMVPGAANWKSALISGLSLCLLLRTNSPGLAVLGGVSSPSAASSSSASSGKHLFNPTNGARGRAAPVHRSSLGLARAMGIGRVLRVSHGVPRRAGREPGLAQRRDLRLHRCYCALMFGRSLYLGEPMAIPLHRLAERRAAAVHLLHDFGPEDHARFARGAGAVCRAGGVRRVVRAVPPVQDERAAVVAGGLVGWRSRSSTGCCRAIATRGSGASALTRA